MSMSKYKVKKVINIDKEIWYNMNFRMHSIRNIWEIYRIF